MPETPENLKMGMFMVNLVVHGASTNTLNDGEYRWSKRRKADETEIPLKLEASKPVCISFVIFCFSDIVNASASVFGSKILMTLVKGNVAVSMEVPVWSYDAYPIV